MEFLIGFLITLISMFALVGLIVTGLFIAGFFTQKRAVRYRERG